jgi:uncharacterized protein YdhG (YjbR/CyaY superfamily)
MMHAVSTSAHAMIAPMPTAETIDEYLSNQPADRRAALEQLRVAAREGAPDADETIAYGMPALRSHGGRFLVSFDAYARHYSLFPASDAVVGALGDEIRPYLAGKGTIRFPADRPIPADLVRRIVEIRYGENAAAAAHGRRAR